MAKFPREKNGKRKKVNKMMFKNDQYILIKKKKTLGSIPQCRGIFGMIIHID